jgi:hypothetical protein
MYAAFARRDAAAVLEWLHPDVEIRRTELVLPRGGCQPNSRGRPDRRSSRGSKRRSERLDGPRGHAGAGGGGVNWVVILALAMAGPAFAEVYPPPSSATGAHYHVSPAGNDAHDGSAAHPWRTIQKAALAAVPGSTVHVAPGSYIGPVETARDGMETAPIRFLSTVRWGARVSYTGAAAQQVWRNLGDWVEIVGFEVTGGGDVRNGIQNDASFARILRNWVHQIPNKGCGDANGGAGIVNGNPEAQASVIEGNIVHDIGNVAQPCNIIHGLYHSHRGGRIANNITFRNQGSGIHLWHAATDVAVVNNLTFANGVAGIVIGASQGVADQCEVRNNLILDNPHGMYESGKTGPNNRYVANLLFGNQVFDLSLRVPDVDTLRVAPGLVDYRPDGTGDYRLAPWSPAIDSGSPVSAPAADIEGLPRPVGAGWDRGPYEWRDGKPAAPFGLTIS